MTNSCIIVFAGLSIILGGVATSRAQTCGQPDPVQKAVGSFRSRCKSRLLQKGSRQGECKPFIASHFIIGKYYVLIGLTSLVRIRQYQRL